MYALSRFRGSRCWNTAWRHFVGDISSRRKGWGAYAGGVGACHDDDEQGVLREALAARSGNLIASPRLILIGSGPSRHSDGSSRSTHPPPIRLEPNRWPGYLSPRGSSLGCIKKRARRKTVRPRSTTSRSSQGWFRSVPIDRRPEHPGTPLWTMSSVCELLVFSTSPGSRFSVDKISPTTTRMGSVRISCR